MVNLFKCGRTMFVMLKPTCYLLDCFRWPDYQYGRIYSHRPKFGGCGNHSSLSAWLVRVYKNWMHYYYYQFWQAEAYPSWERKSFFWELKMCIKYTSKNGIICFELHNKESLWLATYVNCKTHFSDEDQSLGKVIQELIWKITKRQTDRLFRVRLVWQHKSLKVRRSLKT